MKRWWIVGAALGCAACASVLGIPNDTPSFCSANPGHTYCEDFDLGDPLSRMSYHASQGGGRLSIAPSDASPPNCIDLQTPLLGAHDPQDLAGFDKEFTSSGFGKLHIEADMRIVTRGAHFLGQVGFMLISDKQGGCVGLVLSPGGVGGVSIGNPYGCGGLVSQGRMPGGDAGAPMVAGQSLGPLPPTDQWVHIRADVVPTANDGSGYFTFDVVGALTSYQRLPIVAGSLTPGGTPLVGFSAAGLPPTGAADIQFDNVTIDLNK